MMHVDVEAGVIAEGKVLGLIHCHKCTDNNIISSIPSPEQSEDHGHEGRPRRTYVSPETRFNSPRSQLLVVLNTTGCIKYGRSSIPVYALGEHRQKHQAL
jgi:hypothetical protein